MKRISKTEIKEMRSQSKKNRIMFAFTLPTVILYTIFFLVTMLIGVYYSFTDWNGISKDYTFVGLKNYVKVLTDERFREALWFNIGYTIALVVLLIVIPLTIALALNRIRRLSTLFRSIYFIPAVISMVTVGLIWNELFYRAVPVIGEMLNIEALSTSPLGNPKLAAIAIMVVNIWQGCAIPTVLFIAGLQSVPKDLLEAATIDGAGNWARFWNVKKEILSNRLRQTHRNRVFQNRPIRNQNFFLPDRSKDQNQKPRQRKPNPGKYNLTRRIRRIHLHQPIPRLNHRNCTSP